MRRCPFRVNKTIHTKSYFQCGDIKETIVEEEYPFCLTDCAYHNDKNGKCMKVLAIGLSKALSTVVIADDKE